MKLTLRIPDGKFHFHIRARHPQPDGLGAVILTGPRPVPHPVTDRLFPRSIGSFYSGALPISVIAQGAAEQTPAKGTGWFGRRRGMHAYYTGAGFPLPATMRGLQSFYAEGRFPLPAPFPTMANPFPSSGLPPAVAGHGPRVLIQAARSRLTSGFGLRRRRGLGQGGPEMLAYAAGAGPIGPRYVPPVAQIPGYLPPGSISTIEAPEPGLTPPTLTVPADGGTLVLSAPSSSLPPSTNPALDTRNQQLTDQLSSLTPSQLQSFLTSPQAQNQALATGIIPSSITSWFSGTTTIAGNIVSNKTIAIVAAVVAVIALSRKKGKR